MRLGQNKKRPGNKKDELLELINQLSSNELRYFHLYSQLTPKEKNFQKLFKILQGKKTYDSKELAKLTNGKMNLPYEKQYLQKMLLRSLRNYHSESSPEIRMNEYLSDIEILYTHGQRDMAWSLIQRAKAMAVEFELSLQYLILCNWEHRYLGLSFHADKLESRLKSDFADERNMMHEFENLLDYKFIKFNILYTMHKNGVVQGKDEMQAHSQLLLHPLMSSESKATSFKSKILYYEILIHYNMQMNQWSQAREAAAKAVELIERKPNGIRDYQQTYFVMLCNYSNVCIAAYEYQGAEEAVNKLTNMLSNKTLKLPLKYRADIFAHSVERKMVIMAMKKEYREGSEYGTRIIGEVKKYESILHEGFKSVFNFYMGQFYFQQQKYSKSLDYLREILNENYHSTRRDYLLGAMLTNIMAHFELGNYEILGSLITAMNRFCKTNKIQSKFIKLFSEMIKSLLQHQGNQRETKKLLKDYQAKVKLLTGDSTDGIIIGSIDLPSWFARKIDVVKP